MSGTVELRKYLETIGCESYLETLTENGFYTTKAPLASATYEELLDRNACASKADRRRSALGFGVDVGAGGRRRALEVVANFLRSVGLEHTQDALKGRATPRWRGSASRRTRSWWQRISSPSTRG